MIRVCVSCKHFVEGEPIKTWRRKWFFWEEVIEEPADKKFGRCEYFRRVYDTRGRVNIISGEQDGVLLESFPLCRDVRRDETRCGTYAKFYEPKDTTEKPA